MYVSARLKSAVAYREAGDTEKALAYYANALQGVLSIKSNECVEYALIETKVADMYTSKRHLEQALMLYHHAFQVFAKEEASCH